MDAPVLTNSPAAGTGAMPPSPSASPATRYSGIGDRANRRAAVPSTVSAVRMTPSSSSSAAETCTAQPWSTICSTPAMPSSVPIDHQHVAGAQHLGGPRRCEHFLVPNDRHDRRAGAGAGPGVAEWPVDERAARPDRDLAGVQAGHFTGQIGESLGDPRRAQDLRERFGLLVGEPEHLLGLVGVVAGIHHNLEVTGASGDDADAVPVAVLELEPQADAWQQYLFDIHGSILDDDHRRAWPTP